MAMPQNVFRGCLPAVMTPIGDDANIDFGALVQISQSLVDDGMSGVVYCGSMGDWPLLSLSDRQRGVASLIDAGIKVVVGTGAVNTDQACQHARHAAKLGAAGLMIIPRLLSRGTSTAAQKQHFSRVLDAGGDLPSVIYNSPYYGYQTKADVYFELKNRHPNLVGFKEFGGAASLAYAAQHITSSSDGGMLLVGVDTQVYYGIVHCGAVGVITGIGNCLPKPVLDLVRLSNDAKDGDVEARRHAIELDEALRVLSTFDEGPDLTLYYRHLAALAGKPQLSRSVDSADKLSKSQWCYAKEQYELFTKWYEKWTSELKQRP